MTASTAVFASATAPSCMADRRCGPPNRRAIRRPNMHFHSFISRVPAPMGSSKFDSETKLVALHALGKIVLRRYYLTPRSGDRKMSERAIAESIVHLGHIAQGDGFVAGRTPAQWTALRYFARANRFSRTPSAFAEFHGTTRGTASQTTK